MKKEISLLSLAFALLFAGCTCIQPKCNQHCDTHPMPKSYCKTFTQEDKNKAVSALLACDCCDTDHDEPEDEQNKKTQEDQKTTQSLTATKNAIAKNQNADIGVRRSSFWSKQLGFAQPRK